MKKHLVLLALIAVVSLAGCSAKDNARLDAAIEIADAVIEVTAPAPAEADAE